MANKRIKDLPAVTAPTSGDTFAIDGTTTRSVTIDNLVSYLLGVAFTDQHITSSGPATVNNNAGIVRVDQTAGAPITLTLPLAANKTCDVQISDWKGDAGTNNITINTTSPDVFPGGLTSWKIAGNGGSVFLRRVPGVGYAI
jgi:hypothetical protein